MCLYSLHNRWQGRRAAPSAYFQTGILQLLVSGKRVRSLPHSANDRNAGKASVFQVPDSCCRHACWALPSELDQYGNSEYASRGEYGVCGASSTPPSATTG